MRAGPAADRAGGWAFYAGGDRGGVHTVAAAEPGSLLVDPEQTARDRDKVSGRVSEWAQRGERERQAGMATGGRTGSRAQEGNCQQEQEQEKKRGDRRAKKFPVVRPMQPGY